MHKEAAAKLIERADNTGKAIAVFIAPSGAAKATAITTDLYRDAMARSPERLVGIYNGAAQPDWIVADVEYCRSGMSCAA